MQQGKKARGQEGQKARRLFALLPLCLLAFSPRFAVPDEIIDRVLAVVAGDLIMLSDVNAARSFGLVTPGAAPDPTREILSRLIDRSLILAEVDRFAPPEPEAADVDRELQTVRARFPSAQALTEALARVGIDTRHLRETLRQDLRIRAYLDQRFTIVPPSEEELGRYYRERAEAFTRNGGLVPFEAARQEVVQAVTADRRRAVVEDWLAGLRRRAAIVDLYVR
jgi:hypothetical protein